MRHNFICKSAIYLTPNSPKVLQCNNVPFHTIDASIVVFWVLPMPVLLPISCPVFDDPQSRYTVYTVHQMPSKSTTGSVCAKKTNQTFIVFFIIYLSPVEYESIWPKISCFVQKPRKPEFCVSNTILVWLSFWGLQVNSYDVMDTPGAV